MRKVTVFDHNNNAIAIVKVNDNLYADRLEESDFAEIISDDEAYWNLLKYNNYELLGKWFPEKLQELEDQELS